LQKRSRYTIDSRLGKADTAERSDDFAVFHCHVNRLFKGQIPHSGRVGIVQRERRSRIADFRNRLNIDVGILNVRRPADVLVLPLPLISQEERLVRLAAQLEANAYKQNAHSGFCKNLEAVHVLHPYNWGDRIALSLEYRHWHSAPAPVKCKDFRILPQDQMFEIAAFSVKSYPNRVNVPFGTKLCRYYRIDRFSLHVKKNALDRHNRKNGNYRNDWHKLPKLPKFPSRVCRVWKEKTQEQRA